MKTTPRLGRERVRRIGSAVLTVAAIWVLLGMAPEDTTTSFDISSVMLDDGLNQDRAEGAPQQSVVNGWTARDLLEIIAEQGEQRDDRPAALLTLGVLGLALGLSTSPRLSDSRRSALAAPSAMSPGEVRVGVPPSDMSLRDGLAKLPAAPSQDS